MNNWRPIYVLSDLWKDLALTPSFMWLPWPVSTQTLYEAAEIDGANRSRGLCG